MSKTDRDIDFRDLFTATDHTPHSEVVMTLRRDQPDVVGNHSSGSLLCLAASGRLSLL